MSCREKLFRAKNAYDHLATDELFLQAMRENCLFEYQHCPEYRAILDGMGFHPKELVSFADLAKLPFLPTLLFKRHRMFAVPKGRMLMRVTSSGTSGSYSEIGFTLGDMLNDLRMALKVTGRRRLFSPVPCHYIMLSYKPHKSNRMGAAKSAFFATLLAPALSRTYALNYTGGKYDLDLEGVLSAIQRHSRSRFPVRLVGFPAYAYYLMETLDERGIRLKLPKGSKILLGGGWKQFYTQAVDKPTFYALARKVLGLEDNDIVEFFSAVENPILYCDCEKHHLHVPVYSRVLIRDVKTLEPLPNGQPGLVELLTPMVKATPILSVMTDDLGILHDGSECGCGLDAPWLEILGRVGVQDIKTCAAGAAELLSEVEL